MQKRLIRPLQCARHLGVLFDKLALVERGPQLAHEGSIIAVVKVAKQRLHSLSCLISIVEWNAPTANVSLSIRILVPEELETYGKR